MDLKSYIELFLDYCSNIRGYTQETIRNYNIALKLLLQYSEIDIKENEIILNIMPLRIYLSKHAKRAISARLSAIRSFVNYLNKQQNIDIKLKGAQSIKTPKTLPKPLRRDDIIKVINNSDEKTALIVKMLYSLGLRVSEISNIKPSDISNGWIRVCGKGNRVREIPIIDNIYNSIINYTEKFTPTKYLFENRGKQLTDYQIRYIIKKEFAKYGIKATPHQLRHSFASDLLQEGARVSDVSELLGHKSMATTQIYTKLTNSKKLKDYLKSHPLD